MTKLRAIGLTLFVFGCGRVESREESPASNVDAAAVESRDGNTSGMPGTDGPKGGAKLDGAKATGVPDAKGGPDTQGAPMGAYFGDARCPPGSLFCEDFEDDLDPSKWQTVIKNGTVSVAQDSKQVARGKRAIHFKILTPTGERGGFVNTLMPFALAGNHLFVRYFMYVDKLTPDRWYWVFGAADAIPWVLDRSRESTAIGEYGLMMLPNSDPKSGGSPNSIEPYSNTGNELNLQRVPLGQWVCWEFEYHGDNGGEMTVSFNGKQALGNDGKPQDIKGWPAPLNPKLYFGVYNSHDDLIDKPDGFNIWVDSIAVSREKIGCMQ